jgi:hypothetical protein
MKSQHPNTNVQNVPTGVLRSNVPEASGKSESLLAEIRQRAFEIHIERGGIHGCDLEDWLQAEREFREKHNKNNNVDPRKK